MLNECIESSRQFKDMVMEETNRILMLSFELGLSVEEVVKMDLKNKDGKND